MPYTVHPSFEKFMGKTVIDTTTGLKGVVIQGVIMVNGSIMFTIQPRVKADDDSKLPDPIAVDEHLLELVEGGPSVRFLVPPVEDEDLFAMGDRVVDIHTGYQGTITMAVIYLNGCIRYSVAPYLDDELAVKSYRNGQTLDIGRLVLDPHMSEGDHEPLPQEASITGDQPYVPKPGGPMIRGGVPR